MHLPTYVRAFSLVVSHSSHTLSPHTAHRPAHTSATPIAPYPSFLVQWADPLIQGDRVEAESVTVQLSEKTGVEQDSEVSHAKYLNRTLCLE